MNNILRRHYGLLLFIMLLLLPALACDVPGNVSLPIGGPPPTATPMGDTLSYTIPIQTYSLAPGETVPGTRLTYVGFNGESYDVTIDGLPASKRLGDSFVWDGVVAPAVYANFNLRIAREVQGELPVAGPVELVVFNPEPAEIPALPVDGVMLAYNGILVNYLVPEGREIPGTTLSFVGVRQQGEGNQTIQMAELTGLSGYNLFAVGDSLIWNGRLRDNVAVRYEMRVISINEYGLRLSGDVRIRILQP